MPSGLQNHIVQQNNYILFKEQLEGVLRKYPNLKIIKDHDGTSFLRGILDIPNDLNEIVSHFLFEIHCSEGFPYRFPILFEIGGEIPNEADSHKYINGSCCITIISDEILKCKDGITLLYFIGNHAIPYFANYIHKREIGYYKNGEYAHGIEGLCQFYESMMKTNNRELWIQYCKNAFRNLKVNCKRNQDCFCGSGEKYKNCHDVVFNKLRRIGENQVLNDFNLIMK